TLFWLCPSAVSPGAHTCHQLGLGPQRGVAALSVTCGCCYSGMGCLNRDLCPPSLVPGRWSHQLALVPGWQQSPSYHSFSCLSRRGGGGHLVPGTSAGRTCLHSHSDL
ncbi:LOW QUALITY PROTEIN: hypothetical protein MC885_003688, partial [Smutsia gigantea]